MDDMKASFGAIDGQRESREDTAQRAGASMPRKLGLLAAFLAVFLYVDWVSFIHESPAINITPWNPPAGLYFAFLVVFGARSAPAVFAALVLADVLVRGHPGSPFSLLTSNIGIVVAYTLAAEFLRRRIGIDPRLPTFRHLFWLAGAGLVAALVVALAYVTIFAAEGLIAVAELPDLIFQYWLGDAIAVTTVTPALLLLVGTGSWKAAAAWWPRLRAISALAVAQGLLTVGCLVLALTSFDADVNLFHILFLPLTWIAVTQGLAGTIAAVLVVQVGLVAGLQKIGQPIDTIVYHQTLMLTLAATSLLIGSLTSERARTGYRLRQHELELAHTARRATAGEMASALAHELNQPLLAAISYTRAAQRLLRTDEADRAVELMDKAVAQAERAGEVIRGLRVLLGKGSLTFGPVPAHEVAHEALVLARADAAYNRIRLVAEIEDGLPAIKADRTQVEQVLLNLIHNAVEAISAADPLRREVYVRVFRRQGAREVVFEVDDTGPGVSDVVVERLFSPFATTKAAGMGLGLPICQSIIEAHKGRLYLAKTSASGSTFRFKIPAA